MENNSLTHEQIQAICHSEFSILQRQIDWLKKRVKDLENYNNAHASDPTAHKKVH